MPDIDFQHVSKTFGSKGFQALHDVSLTIEDGEFVTVVGPSGCGKSTLLNIAAGLLQADSGNVMVGKDVVRGPHPDRGVIFQQYALFPWMTVQKNVEFGPKLARVPAKERAERARHYIDLVGLGDFANALPKTLSGGMKQRCAIARAYAADPKILLMDEPFGALDALTRVHMQENLLRTWSEERRTVMFVTHDVDEAVYLANRVVVMESRPGRIREIIDVGLPYPRTEEIRLSDEFEDVRRRVWRAVYHQPSALGPDA
ncbi:ABC transporter ATP-binding protein [Lysinimonas soli]|uniref:ABC transporter ATP-binding protein n=1 Tax=Lysinimonas soli TaxID=1074233 RepID=A0ABW0NTW7_9MICO